MPSPQVPTFESYWRQTLPAGLANSPDQLFDACVVSSYMAYALSYHYDNKLVTAVAPAWDDGKNSDFSQHQLKLLSAGNFKPVKEVSEEDEYLRVCAEQNLIDNALRVGDTILGAVFIRASANIGDIEGTVSKEGIRMCKPCRGRSLRYLGAGTVVVSLRGDSLEPVEVTTIESQIEEQEYGFEHEALASGAEAKEFVVEEVFRSGKYVREVDRLPSIPSRKYKRSSD